MAKITIRVDPRTGVTYFPKEIRQEGFVGKIEGLPNALTFTLIKPGTDLADVESSLKIILDDIALRRKQEIKANTKKEGKAPAKIPTEQAEITPARRHPLFAKYSRAWLSATTGYSKGYLCRIATGKVPFPHFFIERVCSALNQTKSELFLPDAVRASPSPEGILPPEKCEDLEKKRQG